MTGLRFSEEDFAEIERRVARNRRPVSAPVRPTPARPRQTTRTQRPVSADAEAKPKTRRRQPERSVQLVVAELLDRCLPPGYRWMHVPNVSGTRTKGENKRLKAEGVKAGAADVLVLTPAGRFIWIELKSADGQLSAAQRGWRDWCQSIGAPWALCRSAEDVVAALQDAGVTLRGRL